jgi:hypothetical protein
MNARSATLASKNWGAIEDHEDVPLKNTIFGDLEASSETVLAILYFIYVRRARIWFVICALSIFRPLDWVDMKKERCNRSLRRIPIFGVASCFRGRIRSVKGMKDTDTLAL